MRSFLFSWRSYFLVSAGCFIALWLSLVLNSNWLLPVLTTLALYPFFTADLVLGERRLALRHVLWWAFVSSVLVVLFTRVTPTEMGRLVLRGIPYRDEMFRWLLTGEGSEGKPHLFIPEHFRHFVIFVTASLLTAGLCGLAFGAILMNYMNFYVGSLSLKADPPLWAFLFGWPIWSLVRVLGFILCGVALAQPLLSLLFRLKPNWGAIARWLALGILLGLLDLWLKWTLAPFWRELLRQGIRL